MSAIAVCWSTVRSYSNASPNSCCQCESGLKAWPDDRLPRGVELEQLLGHVAHGLLDAGLGLLPGRAAEPVERRGAPPGVLLNQVEPLERHEQLVFAGVPELHELLRLLPRHDREALEADEPADAVVDVHDEIADLQIAEVRQERPASPTAGARGRVVPPRRGRSRRRPGAWPPAGGTRATAGRWRRAPRRSPGRRRRRRPARGRRSRPGSRSCVRRGRRRRDEHDRRRRARGPA